MIRRQSRIWLSQMQPVAPRALGHRAHEFAPGSVGAGVIGRMNHDIAGLQGIHGLDLEPVGILLIHVIGFHPTHRARAAHDGAMIGIERAQALVHGLLAMAKGVQDVADDGHVNVLANPVESFGIVGEGSHGKIDVAEGGFIPR